MTGAYLGWVSADLVLTPPGWSILNIQPGWVLSLEDVCWRVYWQGGLSQTSAVPARPKSVLSSHCCRRQFSWEALLQAKRATVSNLVRNRLLLAIFKLHNQQGPTVQHREPCSMLHGSLDGRGVWGRMDTCICVVEFLPCCPEIITAL